MTLSPWHSAGPTAQLVNLIERSASTSAFPTGHQGGWRISPLHMRVDRLIFGCALALYQKDERCEKFIERALRLPVGLAVLRGSCWPSGIRRPKAGRYYYRKFRRGGSYSSTLNEELLLGRLRSLNRKAKWLLARTSDPRAYLALANRYLDLGSGIRSLTIVSQAHRRGTQKGSGDGGHRLPPPIRNLERRTPPTRGRLEGRQAPQCSVSQATTQQTSR